MTKKMFLFSLFSLFFSSCVDSKYDLSKVDTEQFPVGGVLNVPFGKGELKVDDLLKLEKVPAIEVVNEGYVAFYRKKITGASASAIDVEMHAIPVGMQEIVSNSIDLDGLDDLFDSDFKLGLADPRLKLFFGIPRGTIDCKLTITAYRDNQQLESTTVEFPVSPEKPNIWIGAMPDAVPNGSWYYKEDKKLKELFLGTPSRIVVSLSAKLSQLSKAGDAFTNIDLELEMPFVLSETFSAVSKERVTNAFDDTSVSYLFTTGMVTFHGTVANETPFLVSIEMVILNDKWENIGIEFPLQAVEGETGDVTFTISEMDMPKMKNARHLDFNLHLKGQNDPKPLKVGQSVTIDLKVEKTGGVSVNLN